MRIVSFQAPSSKQAMAELRASLGEEAIILTMQTLEDGQVNVTGAATEDALDLVDVLTPSAEPKCLKWLSALANFHEWPFDMRDRLEPILGDIKPADPETILTTLVRALFHFGDLTFERPRKPLMLSGSPGSGKTVTIAKIAAAEVLAGRTVEVFTWGTGRAGSLEQLTALLAPLDLAPHTASETTELRSMMAECDGDAVLVDGPSTNPFNPVDLGALSKLVAESGAELALVLPAGQGYADSTEIGRSYAALGARNMVVTKLDVARRFGGVLGAAEAGLAFTKAGIGPTIGDGLSGFSASGLARLLLHRYRASIGEGDCL